MAKKNEKVEKAETTAEVTPESAEAVPSLEEELEKQKDLFLRTAAEFDNYKKRTERERVMTAEYAKANMLKTFLPVFDNVDRAEECDPQSADYAKGAMMIVKQLKEIVGTLGLIEIGVVGDKFDPNLHEAVMHEENEELEENTITQVFQKGYRIGDTVIRAAMVKVAN